MHLVPLEYLRPGESGRVAEFVGDHDLVSRLEEMGLRRGELVRMVQPGRPCLIALNHQRLSLRGHEDMAVLVDVAADA